MSVEVTIRLRSIEQHIRRRHGKDRLPTPREGFVIRQYAGQVINYIKRRWPVDTGTSRDRWTYEIFADVGELSITIENPMYYAEYVHYAGGTPEDELWKTLIQEAFAVYKDALNQDVAREIDKTERALQERSRRRPEQPLDVGLMDLIRNPDLADIFGEVFGG